MPIDIDPGLTGAVAVLDHAGTLVALYATPTLTLSTSRGSRAEYEQLPQI
jgi:predicted RNase H-like nuclease (RuvC/YqgF family)